MSAVSLRQDLQPFIHLAGPDAGFAQGNSSCDKIRSLFENVPEGLDCLFRITVIQVTGRRLVTKAKKALLGLRFLAGRLDEFALGLHRPFPVALLLLDIPEGRQGRLVRIVLFDDLFQDVRCLC